MYVVGIDGGGTKTIGVISDEHGNVVAQHTVGASNPNSVDREKVQTELTQLFKVLLSDKNIYPNIQAVFAGMSGVGSQENHRWVSGVIQSLIPDQSKLTLDIDGVNALYSGTFGKPGIVNIAGTGSLTYGINQYGERGRAGGWGYLTDDAGSGFAIGRAAVKAVFEYKDGVGARTTLQELMLSKFSINHPYEMVRMIYEPGKAREVIAPLSRLVIEAADEGDEVSQGILHHAATNMALHIGALLNRLFNSYLAVSKVVPIVLTGGVYKRADWFLPVIEERLSKQPIKTEIILPISSPIVGAVAAAWQSIGIDKDEDFAKKLAAKGL